MTTATAPVVDLAQAELAITFALQGAAHKTAEFLAINGDRDCCGFAWVDVYHVRSNSKLGKLLAKYGFSKNYSGTLRLWNPSRHPTQSITAKEVGAGVLANALQTLGVTAYVGSRMD